MTREKRRRVRASDLVDQKGGAAFNVVLLLVAFSLVVLFKVLVADDDDEKDWMEAVTGDPEHELPPSALDRETVGRIVTPDAAAPAAAAAGPDASAAADSPPNPSETDAARTP